MTYASETWAMMADQLAKLERTEMRMIRWMCGVTLKDRNTNTELRKMVNVEPITDVIRRGRLRWIGHVVRKKDSDWVPHAQKRASWSTGKFVGGTGKPA